MLVTAERIFNTKLELNPYGKLFTTESSPEVNRSRGTKSAIGFM